MQCHTEADIPALSMTHRECGQSVVQYDLLGISTSVCGLASLHKQLLRRSQSRRKVKVKYELRSTNKIAAFRLLSLAISTTIFSNLNLIWL